MAIVAVLKTLSYYEGIHSSFGRTYTPDQLLLAMHDDCITVVTFYTTSLAPLVGQSYKPPDLVWLAQRWFETMSWYQ